MEEAVFMILARSGFKRLGLQLKGWGFFVSIIVL